MEVLKRGWQATRKSPGLFLVLIILQLSFLISLTVLALPYQVKILEKAQAITLSLQGANLDAESLQAGEPFLKDLAAVYQNYQDLLKNIFYFLLGAFLLYALLNGLIWSVTQHLIHRKDQFNQKKLLLKSWLYFMISTAVFLAPGLILIYLIFTVFMEKTPQLIGTWGWVLLGMMAVLYYFLLVSGAFLNASKLKIFFQKTFSAGIKRIFLNLLLLIISFGLIVGCTYLFILTVEKDYSLLISLLLILVLSFSLVVTRIFWIINLNLEKEKL